QIHHYDTTYTLRRRGQALPSRESLPHMHNVDPDSAAMARHPTPHGGRTSQGRLPSGLVPPLVARVATRSLSVGLCRRSRAGGLCRTIAWGPNEAAAEEIEMRAAEHLALQHFEAVDMPFDWPGAPWQCHARFDCCIVIAEPAGKALHGLQRTLARPLQPRSEVLRLPLAHEVGKVLREIDRLGHLGRVRVELSELLGLGL